MPKLIPPDQQRTSRICVRLHPAERQAIQARAIQAGMGESDYIRHCLQGIPLPGIPQTPRTPLPVLQALDHAAGWASHASQTLGGFAAWLDNDPRQRFAKHTLQRNLAQCLEHLRHATATLQAASAQARA